jgi:hypothetical protein
MIHNEYHLLTGIFQSRYNFDIYYTSFIFDIIDITVSIVKKLWLQVSLANIVKRK